MTRLRAAVALAGGLAVAAAGPAAGDELHVFAAASLSDVLRDLAPGFEKLTRHALVLNLGASSDLARQIKAGAPADVFFSADEAQMDGLQAAGLVRARDRVELLSNALVVVVPAESSRRVARPQDLSQFERLALADPQAVPAGVYARRWLESAGVWAGLEAKVVPTLNVRAALQAVEAGNADAGIVYRTDATLARKARVALEVPGDQGPAIVYPLAVLAGAKQPAAAELVLYLQSGAARGVYRRHGFLVLADRE